ncbi:MAG TPA: DUF167 domain-containing protein [Candidatus Binatia bacterium]|jgi:uncharacterized protein (TIGR00251 family)|nr:DUF167 domain-containing protein [Candidatus Binatia bacterium]
MARRISVTVQPNSRSATITKLNEREYRAAVREPARDGKANLAVTELLARYFAIPKSRITIIRGHTSRRKIIELAES